MSYPTYNIAVLDIFLQALGEGFPECVVCFDGNNRKGKPLTSNNFKQKVHKMRAGNKTQAMEVRENVSTGLFRLVDGTATDSTAKYCRKEASDKYTNLYRRLWWSLDFPTENFSYEERTAVLAYLVARWLVKSCEKEHDDSCVVESLSRPENMRLLDSGEQQEYVEHVQQVFRSEYYSALWDVVAHGAGNKPFYKWPIDELYKGCDEKKVDEIIRHVFGDNDGNISTTFGKLKEESGVRRWTTFDKLFQNELNDEKLKALLQDDNLLEKYQVFQSRMINAFVLENLRAILPKKIGGDLASEVFESLFRHVKGEPVDLESAFPVPEHDGKVTEYEE